MFLWMVALEVIKQVCCVSRVCKGTITNPTDNYKYLESHGGSLGEHSSVAIFTITVWCLAHVHVHACLGACAWRAWWWREAGSIYRYCLYAYCISQ